jgi:2-keto-4-pentenoate hydratase
MPGSPRPVSGGPVRDRVVGAKVSVRVTTGRYHVPTSPAFSWLTDGMLMSSRAVPVGELIRPIVEAKLAFVLARPLPARVSSIVDVLAASVRVSPCLEVLDARATASVLLGPGVPPPAEGRLRRMRVRLDGGGEAVETPVAAPLEAVIWLADRLGRHAGEGGPLTFLLGPAAAGGVPLAPGSRVTARFADLGVLEVRGVGGV